MKLYDKGVYLLNGTELVQDTPDAAAVIKSRTGDEAEPARAKTQTIAYQILKEHNTSGNMEHLQIKFDKLTSHDITFVGIIQTARASGLEKFPIPYVLTNCHNSLCAVGGTINEDDHMFGLSCAKRYDLLSLSYLSRAAFVSRPMIDWCSSTWFNTDPSTYRYPSCPKAASTASEMAQPRLPEVPGCSARIFLPTWVSMDGEGVTDAP